MIWDEILAQLPRLQWKIHSKSAMNRLHDFHNGVFAKMSVTQFETDYLVVGAGAMGLAFVDELLNESNPSLPASTI